ncbi:hypothetical protein DMB92_00290 [Campylobacter sp. MIT 99-7217]|uniref:hypothetical protein n=1 Tax=Campylobacter sp. MIT 99-7217 TaxID=535091 RepID=UPI001159B96D|nr:hypothetical protein [Campylobacter sp. MIT 99-7217]TQR34441.1 hypothetical protein DMB92_00290 [Campylobacter sp. MIT 99-7217]
MISGATNASLAVQTSTYALSKAIESSQEALSSLVETIASGGAEATAAAATLAASSETQGLDIYA